MIGICQKMTTGIAVLRYRRESPGIFETGIPLVAVSNNSVKLSGYSPRGRMKTFL